MRKLVILAVAGLLVTARATDAQARQLDGPRAAVDRLFDGMRMASASAVREVLAPNVRFAVLTPEGTIASQTLDTFVEAITASQGNWDERLYDVEVKIDGDMASVWAPYTFYLAGRISHCGVNSIELLRDADGWKITQVSDTRRGEGCPDPLQIRR